MNGNKNKTKWIGNEIRIEIEKNLYELKISKFQTWVQPSSTNKKRVKNLIRTKRKRYFYEKFEESINNRKTFWKNINELLHNRGADNKHDIEIRNDSGNSLDEIEIDE